MLFLETRSGLLAGKHIVLIGRVNTTPSGRYHEIDYVCGGEARSTTASADAVTDFLDDSNSGPFSS